MFVFVDEAIAVGRSDESNGRAQYLMMFSCPKW